jgi:hypothetical protein
VAKGKISGGRSFWFSVAMEATVEPKNGNISISVENHKKIDEIIFWGYFI